MRRIPALQALLQPIGCRLGLHLAEQHGLTHFSQLVPQLGRTAERIWVATRMVESH